MKRFSSFRNKIFKNSFYISHLLKLFVWNVTRQISVVMLFNLYKVSYLHLTQCYWVKFSTTLICLSKLCCLNWSDGFLFFLYIYTFIAHIDHILFYVDMYSVWSCSVCYEIFCYIHFYIAIFFFVCVLFKNIFILTCENYSLVKICVVVSFKQAIIFC